MNDSGQEEDTDPLRLAMAKGANGELYRWMRVRYRSFLALLAESRRPSWKRIAAGFAGIGIRDGLGNPPTAETVRQTWWKVRRDIDTFEARSQLSALASCTQRHDVKPAPQTSDHMPLSKTPAFDPGDVVVDGAVRTEFRPARLLNS